MSGILGSISHWAKSPAPRSVNGDKDSRGTKRKAKGDPYDEIDDDDSTTQKTPSSLRTRSRISSEAPSSSAKGRPSSTGKATAKRRSRSSGIRKDGATDGSRVDAAANLARAQEPQAARLHPQPEGEQPKGSLAPVADMGIPEASTDGNTGAAPNGPAKDEPKPADRPSTKGSTKGKAKATGITKTAEAEKKEAEVEAEAEAEAGEGEEHEVHALLQHRMAQDDSGRVELLVHWEGEKEEEATWESEEEIQKGAAETLYAYWKAQGGRINALFIKPKDAPPETYHVFKILNHDKRPRGGFEFEVQWVGHPPTRGETSVEAEPKLKKIAPEALNEYWESVGGREKFLAKRGRNNKKTRTE
ncbi:hypothetical protein F5Y13DRAFT_172038 [Hypoxylon sp. FL1857]|nr:hypothetical protein F5Y13DRAFT_172038 [Hypoxylon sp. FL1857]